MIKIPVLARVLMMALRSVSASIYVICWFCLWESFELILVIYSFSSKLRQILRLYECTCDQSFINHNEVHDFMCYCRTFESVRLRWKVYIGVSWWWPINKQVKVVVLSSITAFVIIYHTPPLLIISTNSKNKVSTNSKNKVSTNSDMSFIRKG